MTTAHRPTWKAAVGRAQEGGWSAGGKVSYAVSTRALPSHTKLKFRQGPQVAGEFGDDRRSALLRESLVQMEEAERNAELNAKRYVKLGREQLLRLENGEQEEERGKMLLLKQTADVDEEKIRAHYDDEDEIAEEDGQNNGDRWNDFDNAGNLESDASDLDASDTDNNDDFDSDDEDEEAALQAELAKIRSERAAAKALEEAAAALEEQEKMEEAALTGNPLLNSSNTAIASSGKIKRRWNDDVVFRNQAKGEPDQNKKRFINDTVRNDFHKRFLNKFIK